MTPAPISVERLRELLDKATPGPWSLDQYVDVVGCDDSGVAALVGDNFSNNGPLIVAAVNALPALLHQLAERDAEVERLERDRDGWKCAYDVHVSRLIDRVNAAELARKEATWLLRKIDGLIPGEILGTQLCEELDAFLAASGGA